MFLPSFPDFAFILNLVILLAFACMLNFVPVFLGKLSSLHPLMKMNILLFHVVFLCMLLHNV